MVSCSRNASYANWSVSGQINRLVNNLLFSSHTKCKYNGLSNDNGTEQLFSFSLTADIECKHLHSSPAIDGQALENQNAELEEEDKEKQEEIERTVPPTTHIAVTHLYNIALASTQIHIITL